MRQIVVCLLLFATSFVGAQTAATNDAAAYKLGVLAWRQSGEQLFASWGTFKLDHGRYLGFYNESGPLVGIYGGDGELLDRFYVELDGAAKVSLYDVAYEPGGNVLASGWAAMQGGQVASFVAQISPAGKIQKVVRTNSFAAYRLCALNNGEVWALGRDTREDNEADASGDSYPLLRLFSLAGGVRRAGMPRSTVSTKHLYRYFSLACNSTAATVYFDQTGEVARYNFADGAVQRWKTNLVYNGNVQLVSLAAAEDGSLFASVRYLKTSMHTDALFRLTPDNSKTTANWAPVTDPEGNQIADRMTKILGISGGELVVMRGIEHGIFGGPLR